MYELKILTNACTALIKLAEKYAEDTSARSNIYHLLRFAYVICMKIIMDDRKIDYERIF
ncbi:MAG: hypothetical protein NC253_14260 [Ruminococcus sp.]|nr:hypothetical protein [Ruminococcus sp.]MCM1382354.1 hypothetical protein [Muribaculaceae bacterium]